MRATTLLRRLLAVYSIYVTGHRFEPGCVIVSVRTRWEVPRCSGCGRPCRRVHDQRVRLWRHQDFGGSKVFLEFRIRRVKCRTCKRTTTEAVPWAEHDSGFTRDFEERCAYFAQEANQTFVSRTLRISWRSVGRVVRSVVRRTIGSFNDRVRHLRNIGVDEISYRKHHEYITTVVDHDRGIVIWMGKGKSAETLGKFFTALGPGRAARLESVTIDMSGAYIKAVKEGAPNARLIFDRFHVQRLVHDALDATRRDQVRGATSSDDRAALKGTRVPTQKSPWNLDEAEWQTLEELRLANSSLFTAYLLKETFVDILNRRQVNIAQARFVKWIGDARQSGLRHFVRVAKTVETHLYGILEYIRTRFTNARTEGLNGKIRTITRRAYGFHDANALMAMIYLCCGGVHVTPAFSST